MTTSDTPIGEPMTMTMPEWWDANGQRLADYVKRGQVIRESTVALLRIVAAEIWTAALATRSGPKEHKLGCDEYHQHVAPKCCASHCWCLSTRSEWQRVERRVIDGKFHIEGNQIIKTSSGEIVPEWEPLILQRGRDHLMLPALGYYRWLSENDGCNDYHLAGIDAVIGKFQAFAKEHPEWMKQPGVTRGAVFHPAAETRTEEKRMEPFRDAPALQDQCASCSRRAVPGTTTISLRATRNRLARS